MVLRFCVVWGDLGWIVRREWEGCDDCGGFVNRMAVFVGGWWNGSGSE